MCILQLSTMIDRYSAVLFLSVSSVLAAQPTAPKPVEAPLRDLSWGQLNFLHTTDTHGWHAGHLQEYDLIELRFSSLCLVTAHTSGACLLIQTAKMRGLSILMHLVLTWNYVLDHHTPQTGVTTYPLQRVCERRLKPMAKISW